MMQKAGGRKESGCRLFLAPGQTLRLSEKIHE